MSDLIPPRKPLPPRAFRNIDYNEQPQQEKKPKAPKGSTATGGRPTTLVDAHSYIVVLDGISYQTAIELGGGNRSLGVREALRLYRESKQEQTE